MLDENKIESISKRLKKIEGQIKGIEKMVKEKKYCVNIFQQVSAVCGALKSINLLILENHLNTCVKHTIKNGDKKETEKKILELLRIYKNS